MAKKDDLKNIMIQAPTRRVVEAPVLRLASSRVHAGPDPGGCMSQFKQIKPEIARRRLQWMLAKLLDGGQIRIQGGRRWARYSLVI